MVIETSEETFPTIISNYSHVGSRLSGRIGGRLLCMERQLALVTATVRS